MMDVVWNVNALMSTRDVTDVKASMYHPMLLSSNSWRGRHGRDCILVGFTTTCASSAFHH